MERIEQSFHLNHDAIQLLQKALTTSFFEAYLEQVENILDDYQVRVIGEVPSQATVEKLLPIYEKLKNVDLKPEEIRKLSQLLLLKGLQSEPLQANHQLTPDSIGYLFVYLIEQFYPEKSKPLTILDLCVGTGNLLLTLLTSLSVSGYQVEGIGIDNDELLIELAAVNSQWTKQETLLQLYDALQYPFPTKYEVVVSDLPVGYYPIDEVADKFEVATKEGHTYAHHLLMEQGMKQVKEAGYGFFLLPSHFLDSDQSTELKNWLGKDVYLQGVIQLPTELFKQESAQKSIVILQNKGNMAHQAKEVLVATIPTLKDLEVVSRFFQQVTAWKKENL